MENMELYNAWRQAPQDALRTITAGNLKGKSDINPQWRIQVLTERFGPVGFGWVTEITEHWTDTEIIEGKTERVAWVRINLRVCVDGKWSQPIEGIGGSKYAGNGRGKELNDEAFKMAETDAISVACKKLGIAADVYWNTTNTKYTQVGQQQPQQQRPTLRQLDPKEVLFTNVIKAVANGYDRRQCEAACNNHGVTISNEIWTKVMEAI